MYPAAHRETTTMLARPLVLAALTLVSAPLAAAGQTPAAADRNRASCLPLGPVPTVVSTALKREEQLINAPATMTVVTEEAIRATPSPSFAELMRAIPGVNVTQISARDVNITSRAPTGSLENSTLVLFDGRSIYQDFFGFVMWDFIPVDAAQIKQIEVIHGPASAVWGSNALTGVVNVITKTPREMVGNSVAIQFGQFDRTPADGSFDGGGLFSFNATHAQAPTDCFAFKISAGLLSQEAFIRPAGNMTNVFHTPYPDFQNRGTRQPRLDARADYDFDRRRKLILAGGITGTDGIIHTGLGPLDVQSGSTFKYGRVAYHHDQFRLQAFVNSLNGAGPLMLQVDRQGNTVTQIFDNQAYDVELSNAHLTPRHALSYGGNFRDNRFNLSLAPEGDHRAEGGAYIQEEIFFLSDRMRLIAGTRVDWFGGLDKTVFSPRATLLVKPRLRHTIRFSFNRAFRAPALLNNYIDYAFFVPTDSGLMVPARAIGNLDLKEESLTAYEAAYSGGFGPMTVGAAIYVNDARDQIYFTLQDGGSESLQYTYRNFEPVVSRGFELWMEGRLNRAVTGFVNYTWQGIPDTDEDLGEVNIPPRHHVNVGAAYNQRRYFGTASVTYQADAYWQDVLGPAYYGWTKPYTMINASAGVRSVDESMTVAMRVTNLLNRPIQQHVFGDVIRRAVIGEVRFAF
jgi:iron complex outermembrane receptor protein